MFKAAYYDEDKKDICSKEINSIEEFEEIISKIYPKMLPNEMDSIYIRITKLTILMANLISIPYYGKEIGLDPTKCKGSIISEMKFAIYDDNLMPIEFSDFESIICKLYGIEETKTINEIYRMYEADTIIDLHPELEGILIEKAYQNALLLNFMDDEEEE